MTFRYHIATLRSSHDQKSYSSIKAFTKKTSFFCSSFHLKNDLNRGVKGKIPPSRVQVQQFEKRRRSPEEEIVSQTNRLWGSGWDTGWASSPTRDLNALGSDEQFSQSWIEDRRLEMLLLVNKKVLSRAICRNGGWKCDLGDAIMVREKKEEEVTQR